MGRLATPCTADAPFVANPRLLGLSAPSLGYHQTVFELDITHDDITFGKCRGYHPISLSLRTPSRKFITSVFLLFSFIYFSTNYIFVYSVPRRALPTEGCRLTFGSSNRSAERQNTRGGPLKYVVKILYATRFTSFLFATQRSAFDSPVEARYTCDDDLEGAPSCRRFSMPTLIL